MKNLKMFGLAVCVSAASLTILVSVAAADNLTSPSGTTYTGEIVATSTAIELNGAFKTISCSHSEIKAKIEKHGFGTDPGGNLSTFTFGGCSSLTVKNKGSFDIDAEGAGSGDFQSFGAEISAETSVGTCVFTTNATTLGSFTGNNNGHAVIDFQPGQIPRTGGNFLCGSVGYLVGIYTVTTPSKLSVDGL